MAAHRVHRPDNGRGAGGLADALGCRGVDLATVSDEQRSGITGRFVVGDPDTVAEQLADDLTLGIDGFTVNLPLNGHTSGRVVLLGEAAAKAVTG